MDFKDIPRMTKLGNWETSYDLDNLVEKIERLEREMNLEMDPDFQRGHVWKEKQQIKYIEFILKGGTTGKVIYLNHPNWMDSFEVGNVGFVCVDGLQRYTAIKRFVKNEIKAYDTYFKDFTGYLRLDQDIRLNINNLKTKKEVLQWYIEMNSGGTPHTIEELEKVKTMLKNINKKEP